MDGKRLIEKIRLRNILSFGDKGEEIELEPLNIIIGQNASGKSNLVDVIKLLRSLPEDKGLVNFISKNGGISEWIWKGKKTNRISEVKLICSPFLNKIDLAAPYNQEYSYQMEFAEQNQRIFIRGEKISTKSILDNNLDEVQLFNREEMIWKGNSNLSKEISEEETSILSATRYSQSSDDVHYAFAFIEDRLSTFTVFSELQTNRSATIRKPQIPDAPNSFLE